MKLEPGQHWTSVNGRSGARRNYVLEDVGGDHPADLVRLRNRETDTFAHVTVKWLEEGGPKPAPYTYWLGPDDV